MCFFCGQGFVFFSVEGRLGGLQSPKVRFWARISFFFSVEARLGGFGRAPQGPGGPWGVPGTRYLVPGTWYQVLATRYYRYQVPGTWVPCYLVQGCASWDRNSKGPQIRRFSHEMGRHPTVLDILSGVRCGISARSSPDSSDPLNLHYFSTLF